MANWYLETGNKSDIVRSSRIRLARNIKEIPFINKMRKDDFEKVLSITENAIGNIGYGLKFLLLKDMDKITKDSLVEKHLISPEFSQNQYGAIAINDDLTKGFNDKKPKFVFSGNGRFSDYIFESIDNIINEVK